MIIKPAGAPDSADIEHLLDLAFGADRHGRTAYRLREGLAPLAGLSLVARDEAGRLIGSLQCWPLELAADGVTRRLTLLGPVAIHPDRQGEGIGTTLMHTALGVADAEDHDAIVLIGDAEYYGRFGFTAAPAARWAVPGPVERHRLLARLAPGTGLPATGALRPASRRDLAA